MKHCLAPGLLGSSICILNYRGIHSVWFSEILDESKRLTDSLPLLVLVKTHIFEGLISNLFSMLFEGFFAVLCNYKNAWLVTQADRPRSS